jgi:2-amino-4-hydroxy-6-hydroxymethyldihydropteridine diphosphokinase
LFCAYIGIGSNLGDKLKNVQKVLSLIENSGTITIEKKSSIYETEPVGFKAGEWFLNMVIKIETNLSSLELLDTLLEMEKKMGREKRMKWGPRIIDLDILMYDDEIISPDASAQKEKLILPHPEMQKRRFVLVPLAEIAPEKVHPLLKKTIRELLVDLEDQKRVRLPSQGSPAFGRGKK